MFVITHKSSQNSIRGINTSIGSVISLKAPKKKERPPSVLNENHNSSSLSNNSLTINGNVGVFKMGARQTQPIQPIQPIQLIEHTQPMHPIQLIQPIQKKRKAQEEVQPQECFDVTHEHKSSTVQQESNSKSGRMSNLEEENDEDSKLKKSIQQQKENEEESSKERPDPDRDELVGKRCPKCKESFQDGDYKIISCREKICARRYHLICLNLKQPPKRYQCPSCKVCALCKEKIKASDYIHWCLGQQDQLPSNSSETHTLGCVRFIHHQCYEDLKQRTNKKDDTCPLCLKGTIW